MKNNNNKELQTKLGREIWLFEQWLCSIEGQVGETQERIRSAYRECISIRQHQLDELMNGNIPILTEVTC